MSIQSCLNLLLAVSVSCGGSSCDRSASVEIDEIGVGTGLSGAAGKQEPEAARAAGKQEPEAAGAAATRKGASVLSESQQLVSRFREYWASYSRSKLVDNRLRPRLDELVLDGEPRVTRGACSDFANRARERLRPKDPELLAGDAEAISRRQGTCWMLHYDGMIGPGLSAVMNETGEVLLVWIVAEG